MTSPESAVLAALQQLEILYRRFEHPPLYTIADALRHDADRQEAHAKNLFLRSKRGDHYYLLIVPDKRVVDLKALARRLGESALGLASPERLLERLGLTPGAVGPFGLLNDADRRVIVLMDAALPQAERIGFHPNINTATLVISGEDLMKFLNWRGNRVETIDPG
jgi:Ala-tRNA(Pro) deacylase